MAKIQISPTKKEVLEALEEYFAPQGFDNFENLYVEVEKTNSDGQSVAKIINDARIVVEGERDRVSKQEVDVFDELDPSMNGSSDDE